MRFASVVICSALTLSGCAGSSVRSAAEQPSAISVWVYAEDDDYRTRAIASMLQQQVRLRDDLMLPTPSADMTIALARNVVLSERYGPDAFSIQVRLLVEGVTRDRFGSMCREPSDEKCGVSILAYSKERYEAISEDLAQQYAAKARN